MATDGRARSLLVTGAAGYVGSLLLKRLVAASAAPHTIVAVDVRSVPEAERQAGVEYQSVDVRSPRLAQLLRDHRIDTVVHLAFVVTPGRRSDRDLQYSIDVQGTRNVLDACLATGVKRLVVTSSGAAYGYHADNPLPLEETHPLRGNPEFAYSHHKRLVEEMLTRCREDHPELEQLVFRVCTILGARTSNQITALFERRWILDVAGGTAPFVFVWDEDLVACLVRGVLEGRGGVYNLAADGTLSMREIARILGKPYLPLPAFLLAGALRLLSGLGLSPYGPEQVMFLKHRPVLSNARLKSEFGYRPRLGCEEVFRRYAEARGLRADPPGAFAGRVVVVSGAASGIGRALALRFAADGARVALLDRDEPGIAALAELVSEAGRESLARVCDVTDSKQCHEAIQAVEERFGAVDVLVNNAGITHRSPFLETDPSVFRRVMDVNFFGALHLTKAAQEALLRSRGLIVVISSVAGLAPLLERSGYSAAKHALHGLFETLRGELAPRGVRVLMVCPGFTATGIERNALGADGGPATIPQSRVGRVAHPRSVAEAVHRAARSGRPLVVLSPVGQLTRWIVRISPRIYQWLMARQLRAPGATPAQEESRVPPGRD